MKTLQPQRVESRHILTWFIESACLIKRRLAPFLLVELLFFVLLFVFMQAAASVAWATPAVLVLAVFFALSAIALYFVLAELVIVSQMADRSQPMHPLSHVFALLGSQRALVKTAILALFIGSFFWVVSLTVSLERDVLTGSESLVEAISAAQGIPWLLECKLAAGFLYFLLLAMFSLRVFFSLPLMLFHDLDGDSAKALSHRAIMLNIQPMSVVLLAWALLMLGGLVATPVLSVLLLPWFGVFIYVAYRHVFLGEPRNAPARALVIDGALNAKTVV